MTDKNKKQAIPIERLKSLDFFRGLTMLLLIAEFTHIYVLLTSPELNGTFVPYLSIVLFHHQSWVGLHFWDLIQPFFMFIVGVAIPFSVSNRYAKGDSYEIIRKHALQRSFILLILGWMLYCIEAGHLTFNFQNVLAQLSIAYFISFLLMRFTIKIQLTSSLLLLLFTEIIYRTFTLDGFSQPFVADHNFGAWLDIMISGELSQGHWVSFNAIPTTAHTIWGVITGQILMSHRHAIKKVKILISFALILILLGYGVSYFTPIIKRIATTSFVFLSGGLTILGFTLFYWLIDILKFNKGVHPIAIVGLNSLFIYLFAHIGGAKLLIGIIKPFSTALFSWTSPLLIEIITSLFALYLLWYICYWLYKNKIFIKI